jgi:4-amino-4-deoxy-L-arabinose transferase-like glycosyltransferase
VTRTPPSATVVAALCSIFIIGIFLRLPPALFVERAPLHFLRSLHPQPGFNGVGFDENLYREYVEALSRIGFSSYPDLAEKYVEIQKSLPSAILPPTRFLYIGSGYLWHQLTGADPLHSLKSVSSLFGILALALAILLAISMGGWRIATAVAALMACAPTQIHMSQHALIDGVFAFVAILCLWLLWQNLQKPDDWRWLVPYTLALALLVLTKENALFAYLGLLASLATTRIFRFAKITRLLLAATFIGPLLGVAILVNLCGSLATTIRIYELLASKAAILPYAIKTGDGPWYRYLVDLLLVSPLTLIAALGAIFTLSRSDFPCTFLAAFIGASYLIMCSVPFGMNLRYANMWDFPLRFLAVTYLANFFASWRKATLCYVLAITLLCCVDLRQYQLLFVRFDLYELVPEGLLRALQILK